MKINKLKELDANVSTSFLWGIFRSKSEKSEKSVNAFESLLKNTSSVREDYLILVKSYINKIVDAEQRISSVYNSVVKRIEWIIESRGRAILDKD